MSGAKKGDIRGFFVGTFIVVGRIKERSNGITIIEKPRAVARNQAGIMGTIPTIDGEMKSITFSNTTPMIECSEEVESAYLRDTSSVILPSRQKSGPVIDLDKIRS